ncbi:MAG: DUF4876 domain-containing protein, partial [Draconibacterium sp.]|nr:DUF4876 domain-containing protein [Draconibacterium sp.]
MKKIIYILILFVIGCDVYETPTAFNFSVTANYPTIFNNGGAIKDAEIIVRNNQTGREFTLKTNEKGTATFEVRGGNYDIIISFSEEHEIDFEGIPVTKTILFSGSLNGEIILENGNQLEINTDYSVLNEGFVIKELYTSGSRTLEGKIYNPDKFVEIYNNSNQVLYSDGLCFGIVRHRRTYTPNPWVDSEGNILPRIPLWSFVAIVPGTGEEYPIQPGESYIIALSGLNHRDDPNGNPNSIDLSKSEWEMYVEDGKYADTPAVPNILMQRISIGTAMGINVRGQVSIIFRLPTNDFQTIFSDPNNIMKEPDGSFDCFMVPFGWIIDGVENPE